MDAEVFTGTYMDVYNLLFKCIKNKLNWRMNKEMKNGYKCHKMSTVQCNGRWKV